MAAREPDSARPGEHVGMQIDQAGSDIESGDVDDLARLCGPDIRGDGCDQAIADGHVANGADLVLRVDNMGAFQQKVIGRLSEQAVRAQEEHRQAHSGIDHSTRWII